MTEEDKRGLFGGASFAPVLLVLPIVVIAIGGVWAMRNRGEVIATLSKGEQEGRAFASVKRSPNECLDGALAAMGHLDEPREPAASSFLEACLVVSGHQKSTAGNKHTSQTRKSFELWSREECSARGYDGDKSCALFLQLANIDPCGGTFKGATKMPAKWDCEGR